MQKFTKNNLLPLALKLWTINKEIPESMYMWCGISSDWCIYKHKQSIVIYHYTFGQCTISQFTFNTYLPESFTLFSPSRRWVSKILPARRQETKLYEPIHSTTRNGKSITQDIPFHPWECKWNHWSKWQLTPRRQRKGQSSWGITHPIDEIICRYVCMYILTE